MQEGTVVRWLKSEGSEVRVGEPIAEIETDKAVVEFESYASGVLQKILVPEGNTAPVGQPIAILGEAGGTPAETPAARREVSEEAPSAVATVAVAAPEATEESTGAAPLREVWASPVARRLAEERGIDLSLVQGTGPGGRITKDDVLSFKTSQAGDGLPTPGAPAPVSVQAETEVAKPAAAAPAPASTAAEVIAPVAAPASTAAEVIAPVAAPASADRVPLSRMRQQIARVTVRSKQEKPHFYVSAEIDMTRSMRIRREINQVLEGDGVRVTVNDLIIKACVEALKKYPKFNAVFHDDGIQLNDKINVGIAIAEKEGLIVPAIMDCGSKSLREVAAASKDLAQRAESGTLRPQEYTGGTFAISNLGMFEVSSFVAIIHPPQSAVLAVGTVMKKPVVRDDEIRVAEVMTATLSADHRIVDGAEGARFLVEVKRLLEDPLALLV